jgi:hypothetical protein
MNARLLLLLLGGCDAVFGLQTVELHADADAPADVLRDAPMCVNPPADMETFDNPNSICPWGFFQTGCDYTVANGQLSMTTRVGQTGQCGCGAFNTLTFGPEGELIEIEAIGSAYEYLFFALHWDASRTSLISRTSPTMIQFSGPGGADLGDATFDPVTTRWWRIRPDADRSGVIAETSADALTWTLLGRDPTPAPDAVKLEFEYGAPGPGETMASTAILDGINACP